jgi:pimeloyl-ACP methyl ester carboxylesterase
MKLLRPVHAVIEFALKKAGFRWELRRQGDQKIGLWRKALRERPPGARPARLVWIPGFGDTPVSWLSVLGPLMPLLRKRFDEVVLVDFPGYAGFLSREKPFASIDLLIQSLGDVLDSLEPRVVAGQSLGG